MNPSADACEQTHTLLVSAKIFPLCEAAQLLEESNPSVPLVHYLLMATLLFRGFTMFFTTQILLTPLLKAAKHHSSVTTSKKCDFQ